MLQKSLVKVVRGDKKSLEKVEVRNMEEQETTIKVLGYDVAGGLVELHQCKKCKTKYADYRGHFVFCPYCGRRIIKIVNEKE